MGLEGTEGRRNNDIKPILKSGKLTVPGIDGLEWNHGARESLGPEWQLHVLPVAEVHYKHSEWEQTAPVPVFHKTQTSFDGRTSVEHLQYATDLGTQSSVAGSTLEQAEARMRNHLPFDIEVPELLGKTDPNNIMVRKANEVSQYFRPKPQESHNNE